MTCIGLPLLRGPLTKPEEKDEMTLSVIIEVAENGSVPDDQQYMTSTELKLRGLTQYMI